MRHFVRATTFYFFFLFSYCATAQWSFEIVGNGTKPEMVIGDDGSVHIAYMLEDVNGYVEYARSSGDGFELFNVHDGYLYAPLDLRLDMDGLPRMAYHDHTSEDLAIAQGTSNGNFIVSRVSSSNHDGWYPSIEIDQDNRSHIFSVDPSRGVEYMQQRSNNSFDVYNVYNSSMDYKWGMSSIMRADGSLQVAFGDDRAEALYLAQGSQGSWMNEVVIDNAYFPSMVLDDSDQLHIAYFKPIVANLGYFGVATRDGNTWSHSIVDTLSNVAIGFSGARDLHDLEYHDGHLYLLYSDRTVIILAKQENDGSWTREMMLNTAADGSSLGQHLGLSIDDEGGFHVVFYETAGGFNNGGIVKYGYRSASQPFQISCASNQSISCLDELDQLVAAEPTVGSNPGTTVDYNFQDSLIIGTCGAQSTVIQRNWLGLNELGETASCTQTIAIDDGDLAIANILIDTDTGNISYDVQCGIPGYSFLWSDGAIDQNRSNLSPGSYSVTITDATGCEISQSFTIESAVPDVRLAANIRSSTLDAINDVQLDITNFGNADFELCNTDSGSFGLCSTNELDSVQLCISKTGDTREGVSTVDLVKAQRILLQIASPCPYNLLAADVNSDGNLTGADLVIMRRLLLEIQDTFPNNENWKFYDGLEQFTCRTYQSDELPTSLDLVAVKLGDLACEDTIRLMSSYDVTKSVNKTIVTLNDVRLQPGQEYSIPVRINSSQVLHGLQLGFGMSNELIGNIQITPLPRYQEALDANIREDKLKLIWTDVENQDNMDNLELFQLQFTAFGTGLLSEIFDLDEDYESISVHSDDSSRAVVMKYLPIQAPLTEYLVHPNPFNDWITITVSNNNSNDKAVISVYDTTGKLIQTQKLNGNAQKLNTSDWHPGFYMIEILSNDERQTRRVFKG